MQTKTLAFTAQVTVDHSKPTHPVDIVTEPAIKGPPLANLGAWLTHVRDNLADGSYVVTYSVKDGITVEGAHQRTNDMIATYLAEPMADLTHDLGVAFAEITDEILVAEAAALYTDVFRNIAELKGPEAIQPGFVDIKVGCRRCGTALYVAGKELDAIARLELPADQAAERDAYVADVRRQYAEAGHPLPENTPFVRAFLGWTDCANSFATASHAKLQARVDALVPQIERKAVENALAGIVRATEFNGSVAATLRANFNIG